MVLWSRITIINRSIADLRNNAKAATISRKAGDMPEPREWDRLITSTWSVASPWRDYSQLPSWPTKCSMQPRSYSQLRCRADQPIARCGLAGTSGGHPIMKLFPAWIVMITEIFGWRESTISVVYIRKFTPFKGGFLRLPSWRVLP